MAGVLNAARRAADIGRKAANNIGERLVTVSVVTETWSAAHNTAGATLSSTSTLVLSPRFKCTPEGDGESSAFGGGDAAEGVGVLKASVYRIGPITRAYPGGGYTAAQLLPTPTSPAQRVYLVLDDGGDQFTSGGEKFESASIDVSRNHQMTLVVQRTDQT